MTKTVRKKTTTEKKVALPKSKKTVADKKVASPNSKKIIEIKNILISQPFPESPKSPYFDIEKKYNVSIHFHPFVKVEGIDPKEFRKSKIELFNYTAIIFTSRNAIDHYFRICEELKIKVSTEMKYFCISEAIALYLQKFIIYRKRKIFFGSKGNIESLIECFLKYKHKEKYILPYNELTNGSIIEALKTNNLEFQEATFYHTVSNECKTVVDKKPDIIAFFSPSGVKSLLECYPKFKQANTLIATFGPNTEQAATKAGLKIALKVPQPNMPSMSSALDFYLNELKKSAPKKTAPKKSSK